MAKICDSCISKGAENFKDMPPVPFAAHEAALARSERNSKRMWIVILVLILALIGTNLAWIIYNSQFETIEESTVVEQENSNGDNNYIGNDGDITYGKTENND